MLVRVVCADLVSWSTLWNAAIQSLGSLRGTVLCRRTWSQQKDSFQTLTACSPGRYCTCDPSVNLSLQLMLWCLPKIAAQHKVSAQAILAVNPGVDFNLIIAGQTVHVPSDAGKLRQLPCCLALQFAEKIVALLVLQAQASQMQALQTQPLQELGKLA